MKRLVLGILILLTLISGAIGSQPNANTYPALVQVILQSEKNGSGGAGSGTIVKHNGKIKILTNHHVVATGGYFKYMKFNSGFVTSYDVLRSNKDYDLALLKPHNLPTKCGFLPLSEKDPRDGQKVWCLGFGYNQYQGGGFGKIITTKTIQHSFLTDVPSISGVSGGPCINENGELLGIRNASGPGINGNPPNMSQTNVINIQTVRKFLEE